MTLTKTRTLATIVAALGIATLGRFNHTPPRADTYDYDTNATMQLSIAEADSSNSILPKVLLEPPVPPSYRAQAKNIDFFGATLTDDQVSQLYTKDVSLTSFSSLVDVASKHFGQAALEDLIQYDTSHGDPNFLERLSKLDVEFSFNQALRIHNGMPQKVGHVQEYIVRRLIEFTYHPSQYNTPRNTAENITQYIEKGGTIQYASRLDYTTTIVQSEELLKAHESNLPLEYVQKLSRIGENGFKRFHLSTIIEFWNAGVPSDYALDISIMSETISGMRYLRFDTIELWNARASVENIKALSQYRDVNGEALFESYDLLRIFNEHILEESHMYACIRDEDDRSILKPFEIFSLAKDPIEKAQLEMYLTIKDPNGNRLPLYDIRQIVESNVSPYWLEEMLAQTQEDGRPIYDIENTWGLGRKISQQWEEYISEHKPSQDNSAD